MNGKVVRGTPYRRIGVSVHAVIREPRGDRNAGESAIDRDGTAGIGDESGFHQEMPDTKALEAAEASHTIGSKPRKGGVLKRP